MVRPDIDIADIDGTGLLREGKDVGLMRNVGWEWVLGGEVEAIATPGGSLDAV